MSAHPPPVPPEQRDDKMPQGAGSTKAETEAKADTQADIAGGREADKRFRNLGEQGRQGNIKQNTTNKGYQQDR